MKLPETPKKSLKDVRIELNITQKEMAGILGTKQPTVSKIEKGKLSGPYFKKYIKFLSNKGIEISNLNLN